MVSQVFYSALQKIVSFTLPWGLLTLKLALSWGFWNLLTSLPWFDLEGNMNLTNFTQINDMTLFDSILDPEGPT